MTSIGAVYRSVGGARAAVVVLCGAMVVLCGDMVVLCSAAMLLSGAAVVAEAQRGEPVAHLRSLKGQVSSPVAQVASPKDTVAALVAHERSAAEHKGLYVYTSKERSDRTGGHEWTERVVETRMGKVRMLKTEDGAPLSGDRAAQERARLDAIATDPSAFIKKEQAAKDDELRARQMLELLPKAFVFESARREGEYQRIDFRPNPDYQPQSMEERVLHGMSGSMLIEPKAVRLHRLDGHLQQDVSIGFGILATIHEGSRFATERAPTDSGEWKTRMIDTDISGRAIFFKSIGRRQHTERTDFREIAGDTTVPQAVALAEQ